jgi:hypothetical protein
MDRESSEMRKPNDTNQIRGARTRPRRNNVRGRKLIHKMRTTGRTVTVQELEDEEASLTNGF